MKKKKKKNHHPGTCEPLYWWLLRDPGNSPQLSASPCRRCMLRPQGVHQGRALGRSLRTHACHASSLGTLGFATHMRGSPCCSSTKGHPCLSLKGPPTPQHDSETHRGTPQAASELSGLLGLPRAHSISAPAHPPTAPPLLPDVLCSGSLDCAHLPPRTCAYTVSVHL